MATSTSTASFGLKSDRARQRKCLSVDPSSIDGTVDLIGTASETRSKPTRALHLINLGNFSMNGPQFMLCRCIRTTCHFFKPVKSRSTNSVHSPKSASLRTLSTTSVGTSIVKPGNFFSMEKLTSRFEKHVMTFRRFFPIFLIISIYCINYWVVKKMVHNWMGNPECDVECEREWKQWEESVQRSTAALIPRLPDFTESTGTKLSVSFSNEDHLKMFPYLQDVLEQSTRDKTSKNDEINSYIGDQQSINASEYTVPLPNYELMGEVRAKLASKLRQHAAQSCELFQSEITVQKDMNSREKEGPATVFDGDHNNRNSNSEHFHLKNHSLLGNLERDSSQSSSFFRKHSLPVLGVTVANDTPQNRYLRRLLYTIDLNVVGSIVITWYDEQTEAQLTNQESAVSSHAIVQEALEEFIGVKGFVEIDWKRSGGASENESVSSSTTLQMASPDSLELLSQITTSIHQYCLFDSEAMKGVGSNTKSIPTSSSCQNELLILRFSTNLGCSSGVNNPLFTHPTSQNWLITNNDIAFPPGVLSSMGNEVKKSRQQKPELAVHTFGFIYGRGALENPWSNFVMTSCSVANVGVWDEDIFPAFYEDDDYRDRIRYVLGKWKDAVEKPSDDPNSSGDKDKMWNAPVKLMNDTHLIYYQSDRSVSVAHGPLSATTYVSGTLSYEEEKSTEPNMNSSSKNPYRYESQRWNLVRQLSDPERFFKCKHGTLPDPGPRGEDALRYFGWGERFLVPFVNVTKMTQLTQFLNRTTNKEEFSSNQKSVSNMDIGKMSFKDYVWSPSPWSQFNFNATRRKCIHEAANLILSILPSEERKRMISVFKNSCSVC